MTETTHQPDLRQQLREVLSASDGLTQTRLAKEAGVSTSTLSQYMADSYAADTSAIEAKLLRWLDAHTAKQAQAHIMPRAPGYQPTPTAEKVIAALRYAQTAQDIAVVYGGAGVGKSAAIQHYAQTMPQVWHVTVTPAHVSVTTALKKIAEAVGAGSGTVAADLHDAICKSVARSEGLLVIDEAQHLGTAALDQIRSIHDATGIGLALVGNEQVYARMTGGNRASYLDRLFSRIGRKVKLGRPAVQDVQMLVGAWGVTDSNAIKHLQSIASKPGALRMVTKVLRLAAMMAASQARQVAEADIRSAWAELGGAE